MKLNVLIVDDSNTTRADIHNTLEKEKSIGRLFEASHGVEALKVISKERVDLILTDLIMPEMDGFKLLKSLRSEERFQDIPVIFLTIRSQLEDRVKGLELGAWDFLVKPVHPVELVARVKAMLRVKALQDNLRNRLHQLERLSVIDSLTGLYNKQYLMEFLNREVNRTKRFGFLLSCMMLDIDNFKKINDTYGHPTGDRVLNELGELISEIIRGYDFAARFGGDEFTLVLPQQKDGRGPATLAERIRSAVEKKHFGDSKSHDSVRITVSAGITTVAGEELNSPEDLLKRADRALYQAKSSGRNCVGVD